MVKNHLKRIAAPKTWNLKRKDNTFIMRPEPAGHKLSLSVPLTMVFRDMLKRVKTAKEMKYILHNKEVLLNGKKVVSHKASVGLMDAISIPETKKYYRIVLSDKGVLAAIETDAKDAALVPMRIKNKTVISGGKIQLNFTNGYCLNVEKDDYKTGNVLVIDVAKKAVKEKLVLEKGCSVCLLSGKHIGQVANVEEIKEDFLVFKGNDGESFEIDSESAKNAVFVIGKKSPVIKMVD